MIYKISSPLENSLLAMPETGMGYQIIDIKTFSGESNEIYIVYNADIAISIDNDFEMNKARFINSSFKPLIPALPLLDIDPDKIKIYSQADMRNNKTISQYIDIAKRKKGGKGATDNTKENATGEEVFVRVSPYENDKRVDIKLKKIIAGTFTTTLPDYDECIDTADNPLDRYALPTQKEIKWSFYIKPLQMDILQRGIVQPAFDHEGGGLEAFYVSGTSENTVIEKKNYGLRKIGSKEDFNSL